MWYRVGVNGYPRACGAQATVQSSGKCLVDAIIEVAIGSKLSLLPFDFKADWQTSGLLLYLDFNPTNGVFKGKCHCILLRNSHIFETHIPSSVVYGIIQTSLASISLGSLGSLPGSGVFYIDIRCGHLICISAACGRTNFNMLDIYVLYLW